MRNQGKCSYGKLNDPQEIHSLNNALCKPSKGFSVEPDPCWMSYFVCFCFIQSTVASAKRIKIKNPAHTQSERRHELPKCFHVKLKGQACEDPSYRDRKCACLLSTHRSGAALSELFAFFGKGRNLEIKPARNLGILMSSLPSATDQSPFTSAIQNHWAETNHSAAPPQSTPVAFPFAISCL
jgi:hypothetical protein